jgi:exosortase
MNARSERFEGAALNPPATLGWGSLGAHVWVKLLLVAVLFCALFNDILFKLVRYWILDPTWSHGFLIPLFSLYFLNQNKDRLLSLDPKPSYVGLVGLLLCIAFYPINFVQFQIAYFEFLLLIPALISIVLFLGGWAILRTVWLPIAYLIFAIPLPDRFYKGITIPMRSFAAEISTVVLNWIPGIESTANGAVIDVLYRGKALVPALDVAEACSGMRLLMAFVALGVAMAYLHERPIWQRIVLLVTTIPIAILCNVIRVSITALIYILWDPRYAQGIYHDLLGLLMLPLAFGLYGAIAWFMSNLYTEEEDEEEPAAKVIRRAGGEGPP